MAPAGCFEVRNGSPCQTVTAVTQDTRTNPCLASWWHSDFGEVDSHLWASAVDSVKSRREETPGDVAGDHKNRVLCTHCQGSHASVRHGPPRLATGSEMSHTNVAPQAENGLM